ncbi:MAG: DNA-formamidopyrimidine glycosylase family protein, partial [Acidimicrobiales bacterium]
MPELPEVETLRRDLDKEFTGKRIKTVEVTGKRSVRRHPTAKELTSRVEGRRLVAVERRGKYLLLRLDAPASGGARATRRGDVVVIHLGMSGQLLRATGRDPAVAHTHMVMYFAGAPQLRFVDPRTFGEVFVSAPDEIEARIPELAHLGFDPVED